MIYVNNHYIQRRKTGLGRYANQILAALSDNNVKRICQVKFQNRFLRFLFLVLGELFLPSAYLLFNRDGRHISPAFSAPICAFRGRSNVVWHDFAFIKYPSCYSIAELAYYKMNFYILKYGSHKIIVPSQDVCRQFEQRGFNPNRITVISPYSELILPENGKPTVPKDNFFLHISNNHPRKNLDNTVAGFLESKYAKMSQLFIVGNFENMPVYESKRIKIINNLTEKELRDLYWSAEAVLIFSLDEGFGYPVVEAASVNTISLTSGLSALREFNLDDKVVITSSEISQSIDELPHKKHRLYEKLEVLNNTYTKVNFTSAWRNLVNDLS